MDIIILIIRELKIDLLVNVVTAFSRAISEVGAVMIVGGNIKGSYKGYNNYHIHDEFHGGLSYGNCFRNSTTSNILCSK